MPAWPAVCNAVRRSHCTVKVAVGLMRAACDSSPDLRAHDNRQQLQIVQANESICMSASACKKLLLEFFHCDHTKSDCAGTSTLVSCIQLNTFFSPLTCLNR
jgi:hypothetical protein